MAYTYLCPLRWGDMDAQGHVNNAAYLDYLQEARVDYLVSGPEVLARLLDSGVLVTGHQVEYLHPVTYSERPLRINLWVDSLGASRFHIGYRLFDGDRLVARARTAAVPFDLARNALRRLTPDERAALATASAAAEPLAPLPRARHDSRDQHTGHQQTGHRHSLTVRWSDLDSYGHVNNVKFYDYVQEARIELISQVLGWSGDVVWMVARQDVDYLRPMDFRTTPYEVRTVVAKVGNRSFTLAAEVRDPATKTVYARAGTVVVGQEPLTTSARAKLAALEDPRLVESRSR